MDKKKVSELEEVKESPFNNPLCKIRFYPVWGESKSDGKPWYQLLFELKRDSARVEYSVRVQSDQLLSLALLGVRFQHYRNGDFKVDYAGIDATKVLGLDMPLRVSAVPAIGQNKRGQWFHRLDFTLARGDLKFEIGVVVFKTSLLALEYYGFQFQPLPAQAELAAFDRLSYGGDDE